jgi:hypothetical protein
MPVGLLNLHGRPFGLSVLALPKHDGVLFKVMSAWEATFPSLKMSLVLNLNLGNVWVADGCYINHIYAPL